MDDNTVLGAGRRARWLAGTAALLTLVAAGCSSSSSSDGPTTTATTATTATTVAPSAGGGGPTTVAPGSPATTVPSTTLAPTSAATTPTPTAALAPTTTAAPATSTTLVATTTTFPLLVQGGVVLVANASGIDGAAASVTTSLGDLGFQTVKATNAAGYERSLEASKIYFTGEGYPAAYSIAQLLGGIPVAAMPTPPPILNALEGLRGANVVVMLGGDLAGKPVGGH